MAWLLTRIHSTFTSQKLSKCYPEFEYNHMNNECDGFMTSTNTGYVKSAICVYGLHILIFDWLYFCSAPRLGLVGPSSRIAMDWKPAAQRQASAGGIAETNVIACVRDAWSHMQSSGCPAGRQSDQGAVTASITG